MLNKKSGYEPKETFETSIGQFISHDNGEFGGELITPKEILGGNFVDIFELDGVVYGIDSCNHMCIGHTNIYIFDKDVIPTLIYETKRYSQDGFIEHMAFKACCVEEDIVYVLVSGECGTTYTYSRETWSDKTYLIKINKGKIVEKVEFDFELDMVENMLVRGNELIVGMDKVVMVIDMVTKDIKAYTGIKKGALKNLMKSIKKKDVIKWVEEEG